MKGHVRRRMVEGIDSSHCIAVFVTEAYRNKVNQEDLRDNCKFEFDYAFQRKGNQKMIAVVMESSMLDTSKWGGELQASLGSTIYVSLTDDADDKFQENCKALADKILEMNSGALPI
jgi:hypothetical protein